MKTLVLTVLMLVCMTASAMAQDTSALCKLLKTQSATAGAAYQPGVDVNGHPVVPADINSPMPSMMPNVVKIPLNIDLAKRLNVPPPTGTELESTMAALEIRKDGSVTWNGQDLTPQAQATCGMAAAAPVAQPVPPAVPKVKPPAPPEHAVVSSYKPAEQKAAWQSAIQPDHKLQPGDVSATMEKPASEASSIVRQEPDQPADKDVIWGQGN